MERQRALALMPDAYGGKGGIAQFSRHLLDALAADGRLDLEALGLAGDPSAPAPSAIRWSIPAPGHKLRFAIAASARAARRPPRVVISGLARFGALALPLAAASRARLWTITHGIEVWQPGRAIDDAALRRSALITTVSAYTRERLLSWCPIDPERIAVLHNAIDLTRYRPGPRPRDLEARYGLAGKKVLLTVSRLSSEERYKGHDRVIPLLAELDRRAGPIHYLIVGTGDDRPRLERLTHEHNAASLVTFAGFVPDDDLPAHYRLADAFVMPSTGEGFGIVFLEAMACGCPVIGGNRDGSVDALANGELGLLVDPHSPADLLAALESTLRAGRRHDTPIPGVDRFDLPHFRTRAQSLLTPLLR